MLVRRTSQIENKEPQKGQVGEWVGGGVGGSSACLYLSLKGLRCHR